MRVMPSNLQYNKGAWVRIQTIHQFLMKMDVLISGEFTNSGGRTIREVPRVHYPGNKLMPPKRASREN